MAWKRRIAFFLPRTDLYLLRNYAWSLAMCVAGGGMVVLLANFAQSYRDLAANPDLADLGIAPMVWMLVRYYAAYAPQFILIHLLPILLMLAGVLAVTRGALANEFVALRAAGVSLRRLVLPLAAVALAVGLLHAHARDAYLPALMMEQLRMKGRIQGVDVEPVVLSMRAGDKLQTVLMGHFDVEGFGHNIWIAEQSLDDHQNGVDASTSYFAGLAALNVRAPTEAHPWHHAWTPHHPEGAEKIVFDGGERRVRRPWRAGEAIPTPMTPAMFVRQKLREPVLRAGDLARLAPTDPAARQEIHLRRAAPWSGLVMTLLGTASALWMVGHGRRPSYVVNMLVAMGIAVGFAIVNGVFLDLAAQDSLSPGGAAWWPVVVGGAAGLALLARLE